MGACGCAAIVADGSNTRTRSKVLTTRTALLDRHRNRKGSQAFQFWMTGPEVVFGNAVTCMAERNQIVELVRFTVVIKQAKRRDVMHWMAHRYATTMLACIPVPLACCLTLPIPVTTSVVFMPTKPSRVVWASPVIRCTPHREALATTKVVFAYGTRLLLYIFATGNAWYYHALSTYAKSMCFLPFAITGKAAKMLLRFGSHIGLGVVGFTALLTGQFNHTLLYAKSGQ